MNKPKRPRIHILIVIAILLSTILFQSEAKPSLYICKHVIFMPDSEYSAEVSNLIIDSTSKHLSLLFNIYEDDYVDDTSLLTYHKNYSKNRRANLSAEAKLNSDYFLCINMKSSVRFGTEDSRFIIPAPIPGGGVMITDMKFMDEEPEYHYLSELYFAIYKTSDGKKIASWQDQATSQDDSSNCHSCIRAMIDGVTENTCRHLSSKSPFLLFIGANAGILIPFDWYDLYIDENFTIGSDFGFSAKFVTGNIFGIDASYSSHSIDRGTYQSKELFVGPCFGFRIFTRWPAVSLLYPNGSIGVATFWNSNKLNGSIKATEMPTIAALSGKIGALFSLRSLPLGFEPNLRITIRASSGDGIVAYVLGIRVGYTYNHSRFR